MWIGARLPELLHRASGRVRAGSEVGGWRGGFSADLIFCFLCEVVIFSCCAFWASSCSRSAPFRSSTISHQVICEQEVETRRREGGVGGRVEQREKKVKGLFKV